MNEILEMVELEKNHPEIHGAFLFSKVNAKVATSETIAVMGGSGQGKSTLLRILSSLDRPDGGVVRFKGKTVDEWEPRQWRKKVCYVAQLPVSVEDNLQSVSKIHQSVFDRKLAEELMTAVGLAGIDWSKSADHLSGGEKQRLALIRSLILKPEVLLLDEATSALDANSKRSVEELLLDWRKRFGTTILWVTHELEQALRISDRIWFMGDHTLLEDRDTASFFEAPSSDTARKFLHSFAGQGGI
jgi:putative ABC transport system ATP-binding protein